MFIVHSSHVPLLFIEQSVTCSMTPPSLATNASTSDWCTLDRVEEGVDAEYSSIYIDEETFPRSSCVTNTSTI